LVRNPIALHARNYIARVQLVSFARRKQTAAWTRASVAAKSLARWTGEWVRALAWEFPLAAWMLANGALGLKQSLVLPERESFKRCCRHRKNSVAELLDKMPVCVCLHTTLTVSVLLLLLLLTHYTNRFRSPPPPPPYTLH
jgi:hypothetical protein